MNSSRPYDLTIAIQPSWKNVVFWDGFNGKGLVNVEISFDGLIIAKGAYVWE